jgi:hypothetical protein
MKLSKVSKDKKGVELTFNTIIIMVLVLLVLVILAYLLIKTTGTSQTATGCTANNGTCSTTGSCPGGTYIKPWGGCKTGEVCCTPNLL